MSLNMSVVGSTALVSAAVATVSTALASEDGSGLGGASLGFVTGAGIGSAIGLVANSKVPPGAGGARDSVLGSVALGTLLGRLGGAVVGALLPD